MKFLSNSDFDEIASLLSLLDGSEDKKVLVAQDLWLRFELTIEQALD